MKWLDRRRYKGKHRRPSPEAEQQFAAFEQWADHFAGGGGAIDITPTLVRLGIVPDEHIAPPVTLGWVGYDWGNPDVCVMVVADRAGAHVFRRNRP